MYEYRHVVPKTPYSHKYICFFWRLDWIAVICLRYWIRRVNKVSLIEPSGDYLAQVILITFNLLLHFWQINKIVIYIWGSVDIEVTHILLKAAVDLLIIVNVCGILKIYTKGSWIFNEMRRSLGLREGYMIYFSIIWAY